MPSYKQGVVSGREDVEVGGANADELASVEGDKEEDIDDESTEESDVDTGDDMEEEIKKKRKMKAAETETKMPCLYNAI